MKVWHKKINTALVAKALDLTGANGAAAHREFDIHSSLQHEKIANLHSASTNKTSMFLVMEKLSGIDVIEYLSMRQLYTEDTVSKIIHQVRSGTDFLRLLRLRLLKSDLILLKFKGPNCLWWFVISILTH